MGEAGSILIVDDERLVRDYVRETLERKGYCIESAEDGARAKALLEARDFDLVITDLKMPGMDGIELLRWLQSSNVGADVVVMTAYATVETAVTAMKLGAVDYITKPFSPDEIELMVKRILDHRRLRQENSYLRSEIEQRFNLCEIIGETPVMRQVYSQIERVALSKATVLIHGESGTGKELVARAIHRLSPRANKPFIKVNCAALSAGLLESELFGHEKGAFTGAHQSKVGRFELAHEGTLLLDEVSEIPVELQAKLLRVLQEMEFERVGGVQTISVDVRILGTTNRDLREAVASGKFRHDLFYRLNVVPIELPPLRKRKEDIPRLVQTFLDRYSKKNMRGATVRITDAAIDLLMSYPWHGNVRELENAIERAVVLSTREALQPDDFSSKGVGFSNEPIFMSSDSQAAEADEDGDFLNVRVGSRLDDVERDLIVRTLDQCNGNRTHAADRLGITVRTLRNKLALYRQLDLEPVE